MVLAGTAAATVAVLATATGPTGLDAAAVERATDGVVGAEGVLGAETATLVGLTAGAALAAKWTVDVVRDLVDALAKTVAVAAIALAALHVGTGFDAVAVLEPAASRGWAAIESLRASGLSVP